MASADYEKIRERISRLKEKARTLSERASEGIPGKPRPAAGPAATRVTLTAQREASPGAAGGSALLEEEFRHKLEQTEQQYLYANAKVVNLEQEKKALLEQRDDMIKDNESYRMKVNKLENEKNELLLKSEDLRRKLDESEKKTSLKYVLNRVEEFISEFMRHSRDLIGIIYESVHLCVVDEEVPGSVAARIKLVESQVQYLLNVLYESVKKYHFDNVRPETINLGEVIKTSVNEVVKKVPVQGIVSTTKCPDKPVIITTDKAFFSEALESIVINSIESMVKGGQLEVSCELREGKIAVIVTDTGTGIPPHLINKVYKPFFTTKKKHHGLGLTRAYWIMQLLKYEVEIQSTVGKGTSVGILIPIMSDQEARAGYVRAEKPEEPGKEVK